MLSRLFLLLFLVVSCHLGMAQDVFLDKDLKDIDSLIQYHQFDSAQRITDGLYKELSHSRRSKKNKARLLEVKFRQALILDRQNELPTKSLRILLEMTNEAEKARLYTLSYRIHLLVALSYEKAENFELTDKYLNTAYEIYKKHNLEHLYSTYCIRRSSYFRYLEEIDSTFYYANQAKHHAEKYHHETDLIDSYILLSFVANRKKEYKDALEYSFLLKEYLKKTNDTIALAASFTTIAKHYLNAEEPHNALLYSDSAGILFQNGNDLPYKAIYLNTRYQIFEALGHIDSAYYGLKQYQHEWVLEREQEEKIESKKLEEQYQNTQKESIIKNKNQQMVLITCLLGLIISGSILLVRKNRRINKQNKIISRQLIALSKTLKQKQILLSELQHRVKNNLQHVISILEIQKESVDFNNIDELIRGNQNRIHSMALLHKKLNVSDHVNDVDLKKYIIELTELVKDSYDDHKKAINLDVNCEVETISIDKALPLGMILVELVSNSMKHAFKQRNIGIISIEITKHEATNRLYYADNGISFDFNKTCEKGLGQEIIKGFIDQLNGTIETKNNDNGFELTVYFD